MNILAVDSSSENLSMSMLSQGKILFDFNRRLRFCASKLVPFLKNNLAKHRMNIKNIDIFAIGRGPGSFTGLRVSFSAIKAFMLVFKKPVVCVDSFYSIAYPFKHLHKKIAVISDARRNLIYAASFHVKSGVLLKEKKEKLVELRDFVLENPDYFYVTYDTDLYKKLHDINSAIKIHKTAVYPKAKYFLEVAQDLYKKRKSTKIEELEPLYLHPKTCQIRIQKTDDRKQKTEKHDRCKYLCHPSSVL